MRYRCVLFDPGKPKPPKLEAAYFNSESGMEDWAKTHLKKASPQAYVVIYETTVQEVRRIYQPKEDTNEKAGTKGK